MAIGFKKRPPFSSLRACRNAFKDASFRYRRLSKRLPPSLLEQFEASLENLDKACAAKDLDRARFYANEVQQFLHTRGKKTTWDHIREFVIAIVLALIIAALVRQMWFELYEIPSGSMRPTFKESDRVFVLKDSFGINVPFETRHLYFEPELVQRGTIVVITGDKLDLPDVDTVYFGLFPGKRRYVKRCVAKDGDTIYFYGGRIYGIDKEGHPIAEKVPLEHIPFITFEGKVEQSMLSKDSIGRTLFLRHMDIPIAKITFSGSGASSGQVATPDGWKKESLSPTSFPQAFFEFWGIGNYGISKLIEPKDLPPEALQFQDPDAKLYLEIKHTPTLASKQSSTRGGLALLETRKSWIPIDEEHCNKLKNALYTSRFFVRHGKAYSYTPEGPDTLHEGVFLDSSIPDGCYEFFNGIAYQVGWGAITHQLDPSHPIYPKTAEALKVLYNSGIELSPLARHTYPRRYAYFQDGNLVTLSQPIFEKDEPALATFVEKEKERQAHLSGYIAFVDNGPPLKDDGTLDSDFIRAFGLKIQEHHYLLFGDNHANSNDSRFFGAVPQENLQGSPALIFWPPGNGWGAPEQPSIPFFRASNVIVLTGVICVSAFSFWLFYRRTSSATFYRRRKKRRLS